MANIPKFEDTEDIVDPPKFEDTEPVSFEDTEPLESDDGKLPDSAFAATRPEIKREISETGDVIAGVPGRVADLLGGHREGLAGYGLAQKAAAAGNAGLDELRELFSDEDTPFMEKYKKWREYQKQQDAERAERNPELNTKGNVLGAMTTPNVGTTAGTRIVGNAALAGADAATREDTVDEALKSGRTAGLTAGGLQSLMEGLGKFGRGAKAFAEDRTLKSMDPVLSQTERLNNKGTGRALAREMLDEDVIRFGSSVEDMAPRVDDLLTEKGRRIGEIRQAADDAGAQVDFDRLLKKGDAKVAFSDATNEAAQEVADIYARNAERFAKVPKRTISEAQEEVMSLNPGAGFDRTGVPTTQQQAFRELRSDITGQMGDEIARTLPDQKAEYDQLLGQFSMFKDADKILDKSVARSARNADFGLRDLLVANAAAKKGGVEGAATGMAGAVATKLARERGNAALAVTADRVSQLLGQNPARLGRFMKPLVDAAKRGNQAFMATHMLLMKDPEYQALAEGVE